MNTDPALSNIVALPIVVFGRDDKGKPHASRFGAPDAALAERAAGLMSMKVLRISTDEQAAMAATLPSGRVFASGRGFVPFVRAELFAKLEAAPEAFIPDHPADVPASTPSKPKGGRMAAAATEAAQGPGTLNDGLGTPPADWGSLAVGSLALAAEEGKPAVWYVCTIVADRGEDLFELRWLDDGDGELPLIVRRREHLGLFPPALIEALA